MASISTTAFSIYTQSHSQFPNSKSKRFSLLKHHPLVHHPTNKHFPISFHPPKVGTFLHPFTCFDTPSSNFSNPTCENSPRRSLTKFVSEKIAFLLIGTFIFIGSFNKRAAIAITQPSSSVEEKVELVEGKDEEERWEKVLEKDPRNVEALKVIMYGKIKRGKSKEAVKFVESLIDVEPNEVEWRLLLALCYETMGELSKAKRLFREILKQKPLLVRALHGLAMVMHKNHEGPAMFEMLTKAQELASHENRVTEDRNIRILIAQMLVVQGALEEGLKKFQELVDENPRDFRPYLCQGIIYSLLDKNEEAAKQFETYQALVPKEFPQRGFLDDVALTARGTSRDQLQKKFGHQLSSQK
ncbi:PREDICTED: protein SLOW GREEN 1, chloroplastic [Lupinus angustifolius]|uniref:protein SLOW GREEN 1, chloroplastic n=1 Tax=Lupinus angustifolius TaxID=3871 RepID=UPI00092F7451|nr:PREDICTED: protein SLOW GREEN 1, chloroplastic [Lupinus angustifolius]